MKVCVILLWHTMGLPYNHFSFSKKYSVLRIIIWKAQGVSQNNVARPKLPEKEDTSPTETTYLQVNNGDKLALPSPTEVIDQPPLTYK